MFVADAAADATQISSHNFTLFQPDATEQFPWSFYAENRALGIKVNVDMAGMVRAVETLSGKQFIYYADIPKEIDLVASQKEYWKKKWTKENTVEQEMTTEQAFEDKQVEQDKWYTELDVNTLKVKKYRKQIGETTTGYELDGEEVKEIKEPIWEQETVPKKQLKDNVRFDEATGKFYQKTIPTEQQAEEAAVAQFTPTIPKWLDDRLTAQAEPIVIE